MSGTQDYGLLSVGFENFFIVVFSFQRAVWYDWEDVQVTSLFYSSMLENILHHILGVEGDPGYVHIFGGY